MKLINADDLLEHAEVNGESEEFIRKLDDYIKDAPRVNKSGVWLFYRDDLGIIMNRCSNCGEEYEDDYHYCPNCGAEMEE